MALANYAASGLGEKTACLELGGQQEFGRWKTAGREGYFTEAGIDYYPGLDKTQIPMLLNCGYEIIIMDFGDDYRNASGELLRCDRKIILLSLNPWQEFAARKLVQTVQSAEWGNAVPVYAGVHIQKPVKKALEKEFGISVLTLPVIPDPVCIRAEEFPCMDLILGRRTENNKRKKARIPIRKRI